MHFQGVQLNECCVNQSTNTTIIACTNTDYKEVKSTQFLSQMSETLVVDRLWLSLLPL